MRQPKPFFRKQKQCWYVQIEGRRISLGKDKEQAWKRYHEIMAGNRPIVESTVTVVELLERYLDWVQANRKPTTYDKIRHRLRHFSKHVGLKTKVMDLAGADLAKWVESEKTWNSTTRSDGIACVIRCFNWAVERRFLSRNPVDKVPDKPKRKRREVVYSPDDWTKLRSFVNDQQFGDFLDFLYETGCRPLEARTMEAHHIDLENEMVVFPPSESKGERNERVIYLSDKAVEICVRNMKPNGPIFLNTQGRPWTKDSINCRFHRLKKKLGKQACAYGIRHTYATENLKDGMDSLVLSQLMGHVDNSTLARVYAHLSRNPEFLRMQVKKKHSPEP
ncbi:tyrosine-type recombinase/integrase [Roseiconus lacunae]|uniref:tyrosine-type recombinase/integrase n=1 Tax=Roseiconus lacunae TaxID=2605694 RepID=UPI001E2B61E6|nr:tyrosine-type recombinase/integrase [Roseiconus lacunae]MCD0458958.1 tyrosine-type recombinase/integrase [Roseiconus lacunae]